MLAKQAPDLRHRVQAIGTALRTADADLTIAAPVIAQLSDLLDGLGPSDEAAINPLLLANLHAGTRRAATAGFAADRTSLRMGLEAIRVALRDIADDAPITPTRDLADVTRWIDDVLTDIPDSDIADLLGVSARTWSRWLAGTDPDPANAAVLRTLAATLSQLRASYTARGCLAWFDRPHPNLDGQPPRALLNSDQPTKLLMTAAGERASIAT